MSAIKPNSKEAYRLLHEGTVALAEVEHTGIRVDVDYCKREADSIGAQVETLRSKVMKDKFMRKWRKRWAGKFDMGSDTQLRDMLFGYLKLKNEKQTTSGQSSVDKTVLDQFKEEVPVLSDLLAIRQLEKAKGTYLEGFIREAVQRDDGTWRLHPSYQLHRARTYRSACEMPNFQNVPVRDKEMQRLVRESILPSPGNILGEIDYAALEVRIAACYHQDANMLTYIKDPTTDMHRDVASDVYLLPLDGVTKDTRYCGKNKFVFPVFYGSYFEETAKALWEAISQMSLATVDGTPMKQHLRAHGIKNYDDFKQHVKRVEDKFWGERFPEYHQWRVDWYANYLKKGFFCSLTGFTYQGAMARNDVINYPVQGSAFHCLLWSLIQMVRWLRKNKMKTRVVGQIHDSMLLDIYPPEKDIVLAQARHIMTQQIMSAWSWICVPLDIGIDLAPQDKSWYHKQEISE